MRVEIDRLRGEGILRVDGKPPTEAHYLLIIYRDGRHLVGDGTLSGDFNAIEAGLGRNASLVIDDGREAPIIINKISIGAEDRVEFVVSGPIVGYE